MYFDWMSIFSACLAMGQLSYILVCQKHMKTMSVKVTYQENFGFTTTAITQRKMNPQKPKPKNLKTLFFMLFQPKTQ